jgi:hypothetical protein
MRRTLAAILTLGAALAMPGLLVAQNVNDAAASGVVVSIAADSLVLRLDDGTRRSFVTDFVTNMPTVPMAEGQRVTVLYRILGGGQNLLATTVVLADPLASPLEGQQRR